MEETKKETFTRSVLFEKTGQRVTITVSVENCAKKDYRNMMPVVDAMVKDIRDALQLPSLRADSNPTSFSVDS